MAIPDPDFVLGFRPGPKGFDPCFRRLRGVDPLVYGSEPEALQHKRSPSLVVQSAKRECDINAIMARYERDGLISHYNEYGGQYGDFSNAPEFHRANQLVTEAGEMFMSLPAAIRARFENDPSRFLTFAQDPINQNELIEMGLAKRRPEASGSPVMPPESSGTSELIGVPTATTDDPQASS